MEDGDKIIIDSASKAITWDVDSAEESSRKKKWEESDKKELTMKRGVLYRYARDVAVSNRVRCSRQPRR